MPILPMSFSLGIVVPHTPLLLFFVLTGHKDEVVGVLSSKLITANEYLN